MKQFFKAHGDYIVGLLIISWVVIINLFPRGYIVVGGDTAQYINLQDNYAEFLYEWLGRASLFYFPFYLLDKAGISDTNQLPVYLGIFLVGAYVSFDLFFRITFPGRDRFLSMVVSLIYAINLYTLYIFTYSWGFSHYQIFYIFIPILTGAYIKILRTADYRWIGIFALIMFFASAGFGNPAFALSFGLFLFILTLALIVTGAVEFNRRLIKPIAVLVIASLLVNAYWLWPVLAEMRNGLEMISSGITLDLDWWLSYTSNRVIDTMRYMQFSNMYFPDNFPYRTIEILKPVFISLTFLPIFLIISGIIFLRRLEQKRIFLSFIIVLLVFIMLVARVRYPFVSINYFLFHLNGLTTLRSYEKTAIFTPFIITTLIGMIGTCWYQTRRKVAILILILLLITPLPFFIGRLQQNMSAKFGSDPMSRKDYRKARYSFLVKIPDEYYKIQKTINNDPEISHIVTLPYNMKETYDWMNYEKWKMLGTDITMHLYNKEFIGANSMIFGDWLFAKDFNESTVNPEWLPKLAGVMNAKYIIYHTDVEKKFIEISQPSVAILEENGDLIPLEKNDYFTLYQINEKYFLPRLSWQRKNISLEEKASSIMENYDFFHANTAPAVFRKIGPKRYSVQRSGEPTFDQLILAEPYNSNWRAFGINNQGQWIELTDHFKARGYANGWIIDNKNISQVVIEYYPIRYLRRGAWLSGLTLGLIIIYLIIYGARKRKYDPLP